MLRYSSDRTHRNSIIHFLTALINHDLVLLSELAISATNLTEEVCGMRQRWIQGIPEEQCEFPVGRMLRKINDFAILGQSRMTVTTMIDPRYYSNSVA